jgi:hypothetical protein
VTELRGHTVLRAACVNHRPTKADVAGVIASVLATRARWMAGAVAVAAGGKERAVNGAVSRLLRRFKMPAWIVLMILAAVLFLAGSASFGLSGARQMAQVGVLGAIAAVAVLVAFSQ